VAPESGACVLAAQLVQTAAPSPEYRPDAHEAQSVDPAASWYDPAKQLMQARAPRSE